MNYYNENDPKAAAWLRELIALNLIPFGHVDTRSITEISPHELTSYTQQHFFAGIGGWSLALALAGWPANRPVRTGSCPCQPFSDAGSGLGEADPRHLWPFFRDLITFGDSTDTIGEQVASKAGRVWLARVRADMEGLGYDFGAADLCSAGIGSPNRRQRLYWLAHSDGWHTGPERQQRGRKQRQQPEDGGAFRMANPPGRGFGIDGSTPRETGHPDQRRESDAVGDSHGSRLEQQRGRLAISAQQLAPELRGDFGYWSAFDLLACTDGKTRRIEPGAFPLVARLPAGVVPSSYQGLPIDPMASAEGRSIRLRGYGNAINPWLAAEFIAAYLDIE